MRSLRISGWIIAFVVVLALGVVYTVFDPAETVWMPKCIVHTLTGLDCPGCGSQRAFHSLLHGDFKGMMQANAFLVVIVPILLLIGVVEIFPTRFPRLNKIIYHPWFILSLFFLVILWTIIRNLI